MKKKICSRCKEIKSIKEFYKDKYQKDKHKNTCINCSKYYVKEWSKKNLDKVRERNKKFNINNPNYKKELHKKNPNYYKEYYKNNKERILTSNKIWRENNIERKREMDKKWRNNNIEKLVENRRNYYKNNLLKYRESYKKYLRERRKIDPAFRLNHNTRKAIWESLKRNKGGRHWEELVGYTLEELIIHIEKQFEDNMNWSNYGKWHLEHIMPISSFNFNSYEDDEFLICWDLNNLKPLWAKENRSKSNKFIFENEEEFKKVNNIFLDYAKKLSKRHKCNRYNWSNYRNEIVSEQLILI